MMMKLSMLKKVRTLVGERDDFGLLAAALADGHAIEVSTPLLCGSVTLPRGGPVSDTLQAAVTSRIAAIEAELQALGVELDVEPVRDTLQAAVTARIAALKDELRALGVEPDVESGETPEDDEQEEAA